MGKVIAQITTSVDGYVTGPDDGPGCGLGVGGERLHYWVFGGPWTYDEEPRGEATGADKELLDEALGNLGAVIAGRRTYDSAGAWGGTNPWGVPFFILTHRTQDAPSEDKGFIFVDGFDDALAKAGEAAGDKAVCVMGGADVIRQALAVDKVDVLALTISPLILGAGKRLFDGLDRDVDLEQIGAQQSKWATHLRYRIVR